MPNKRGEYIKGKPKTRRMQKEKNKTKTKNNPKAKGNPKRRYIEG